MKHRINASLSIINAFFLGIFSGRLIDIEKVRNKKTPLLLNTLVLAAVLLVAFIMIYGEIRRVDG